MMKIQRLLILLAVLMMASLMLLGVAVQAEDPDPPGPVFTEYLEIVDMENNVPIRTLPEPGAPIITTLTNGDFLKPLHQGTTDSQGKTWMLVEWYNYTGWVKRIRNGERVKLGL